MIRSLQTAHEIWSKKNFGHKERESVDPLMGISEEYGELLESFMALASMGKEIGKLNHHFLKRKQGIRKTEDHEAGIRDAMADIFIYMMDFANREGIDLQDIIVQTVMYIHRRDWVKNPDDAHKKAAGEFGGFARESHPPVNVGIDASAGVCLPVNKIAEGEPWQMGRKK